MLTVVGVTIVLFVERKLALATTAITPILVFLAYRYSQVSHPVLRNVQQRMADVATVAEENIVGVHVVKAFAQEEAEATKFGARTEKLFRRSIDANRQRACTCRSSRFYPDRPGDRAPVRRSDGGERRARAQLVLRLQRARPDARDAASDARDVDRAGAARDSLGRADLRGH